MKALIALIVIAAAITTAVHLAGKAGRIEEAKKAHEQALLAELEAYVPEIVAAFEQANEGMRWPLASVAQNPLDEDPNRRRVVLTSIENLRKRHWYVLAVDFEHDGTSWLMVDCTAHTEQPCSEVLNRPDIPGVWPE